MSPERKEKHQAYLIKSLKMVSKKSLEKARKVKSSIAKESISEEEEKKFIQIMKNPTLIETNQIPLNIESQITALKHNSNKITPRFIEGSNPIDNILSLNKKPSILSKSRSSFKSSPSEESEEDESSSSSSQSNSDKSSSEFDINKSVHTSQDHSSQAKNDSSSRRSNNSVIRVIENISPEEIKNVDKRKTSASTKENKNFLNPLNPVFIEDNRAFSPESGAKNKRFSVVSSAFSFTSNENK